MSDNTFTFTSILKTLALVENVSFGGDTENVSFSGKNNLVVMMRGKYNPITYRA